MGRHIRAVVSLLLLLVSCLAVRPQSSLGIFESQSDVGSVVPPGTLAYDAASRVYTVASAGANLWGATDGFHFVWKKVSGDVALAADMNFPDTSGNPNPHRKTLLIFRQTLDADSVYVDAAQHGSGMTAVQFRSAPGDTTQDIELNIAAPHRIRLEKRGDTFTMFLSTGNEPLHPAGASIKIHLDEPFYVGIGVCSHNPAVTEKASFSNVELTPLPPATENLVLHSTLAITGIDQENRRQTVITTGPFHMQAPNWSRDGKSLLFDRDGKIWTVPAEGGTLAQLNTGAATRCTGSHGFSPDGKWLAISCSMPDKPETRVYIIPASGGDPRLVTENPASYFHSWSPDGKTIAFTRPSHGSGNIYSISIDGGPETALTTGSGISDDPDYSPDGKYIYFNSDRSGSMQIWRMFADGSHPEPVTSDDFQNWTPHPSPDGKSVLILSYAKNVTGHPANKDIALRILNVADGRLRVIANLVGGSGTDNTPDWAPDSQHLAFVSYQMLPAEDGSTP
jgi:TolB protein